MKLRDQEIFKIALTTALVGMVGMIIFAPYISPRNIKIEDINPGILGEEVCVEGLVEKVDRARLSETYFLTINDGTAKTKVVIFEGTGLEMKNRGFRLEYFHQRKIRVTGKVAEYQVQMEIILEDAKNLKILL